MSTNQQLQALVINVLEEMKATGIEVLDVRELTTVTDYMIIATGRSSLHVKSIADKISLEVKQAGFPPLGAEGKEQSEWVLVDLGDIIVHIMQAEAREFYALENLWHDTNRPSNNEN